MTKVFAILVISSALLFSGSVLGQTNQNSLQALPPELMPAIEQLARLLQENITEGRLSEGQLRQNLAEGNVASVIDGLGPEASRLFEDLRRSLTANYSEESLRSLLAVLMQSMPAHP